MKTSVAILFVLILAFAVVPIHQDMVDIHDTYPTEFRSFLVPSSGVMKVASLGQRNFWSDMVFIWAIQFFDRYGASVRDQYLFHTFDVITDLDPKFSEAYIMGDLFLSLDERWDLLYELADKGLANNPMNWLLAWDAGTYAFFSEKAYDQALKYYSIAYERNPKNPILKDLLANAYKYRGDYETSLTYWLSIRAEFKDQDTSQAKFFVMAADRNIFDLTIKIHLRRLSRAIKAYRKRKGRWPATLGALVTSGYLESLPLDPEGKPYAYDSREGRVWCPTPFKFRGKYAQW